MHPKYRLSNQTLKELNRLPDNKTHGLPGNCLLKVGGLVHLTTNIAVELGLTNGTEGVIQQIILDDREFLDEVVDANIIQLKYLPKCVLVRIEKAHCDLSQLPKRVFPISPIELTFKFSRRIGGKKVSWTIHRTQLPLVPSNCITSYKSQGKDISPMIIDLCPPKGLNIDSSFAYVMLSRCKCLTDLGILRPFPFEVLATSPSKDLLAENKRLKTLAVDSNKRFKASKYSKQ